MKRMMAWRRLAILLAVVLVGICWVNVAAAYTLDIQAFIDGRDQLIIKDNTLQWEHFDYTPVGLHDGGGSGGPPYPTIITTAAMGTVNWYPDWPGGAFSSVFTSLNPALPNMAQTIGFAAINARQSASMVQQPAAGNGYTGIVEFNDNGFGAAAWYEVQLTYTSVPIPGTLALLGPGLLGLAVFGRRKIFKK